MNRTQLVTTADLSRDEVDALMKEADRLAGQKTQELQGQVIATMFFEPSTRTRLSFESAALHMGAQFISVADASTTSTKKGETLADTIRVFDKFADLIIMRQPTAGAAAETVKYTQKPFINGGDGSNQHPSQSLLDIYTIQKECGSIDGKTITFVGDLKHGRTVHSLLYILALYDVKILFVSPDPLRIPDEYKSMLTEKGIEFSEMDDLETAIPESDVLYMTRIQKERFENPDDYESVKGIYVLTSDMVKSGKQDLRVLHPLPRVDEIEPDVDDLPQAAYFRQVQNGLYMRMALLKHLIDNAQ